MNAVSCPRCGGDVPVPDAPGSGAAAAQPLALSCPGCASHLEVSIIDGAETVIQPQLLPGGAAPAYQPPDSDRPAEPDPLPDPTATLPLGSRTAMLSPESGANEQEAPGTVLRASLVIVGAEPGRERLTLSQPRTTVGRESADIVIPDPAMSARHFEIELRGGEYFVRDLESSNGTFLNGDRIRAAELASGDTIRAGQSSLTFRIFEAIAIE
jgi:hypothetical protein